MAYSYFGNATDSRIYTNYLGQIQARAEEISELYPGWIMRVYFHLESTDFKGQDELCSIWCKFRHVDLCNVENLPVVGDLREVQPIGRHLFSI